MSVTQTTPVEHRERILALYRRHVNAGQARLASLMNLPIERSAQGAKVWDHGGQDYLDAGGYGVFLLGHGHPTVIKAVTEQLQRLALSTRLLVNGEQACAAAELAAHCPGNLQYVFFCNSGAEATEAALKLAQLNGCQTFVSMSGGYHGKTLGALAMTGRELYTQPFAARLGTTHFIPFDDAEALEATLAQATGRALVILEPIQAEGGVLIPNTGYLRQVREACDRHAALLIFDEIQCGMGRTGTWWACDREGVVPDMLLIGKGLSGGCVPVGAMVTTEAIYQPFNQHPFIHSSTFAGNPLAMAAVRATLQAMDDEAIVAQVSSLGEQLAEGLRHAIVRRQLESRVTLRAAGLLLGIACHDAADAGRLAMAMLERHVIVCHSMNDHRVVRLTPPATLTARQVADLIRVFDEALLAIFGEPLPDTHGEPS
ncbi:aspartate aminotransferase family protein [Pseudomonas sessilinigenes]|uniref:Aminotransferase class III-fold pyridoxal phosphate-dependent enzyme n=1 Tax=Pseudomonas sessilinigenes TaxID=658629 RepID=A0ABX8MJR2_9PSED|nr:aminotransferase class III-fold pyridoxal phosphate-dependent enzyme [Pseudomonas sessilinigenes]AZC26523.1 Acetylornithine aminotransferase [Pseudomonas sessilinigenes]QXH39471.1 aminotransferase class III-fold pyridoxal phosphate-dependent enzyme [Pseudomonas sessilinigenes]